jgi:uncharacterized membrane protein YgcG
MVKRQVQQIQSLMDEVMTEGEHYANPKWASSPILKKAGAEKISFAFRLSARFETEMERISPRREDLPPGHREYIVTCRIFSRSGEYLGMAKGSCSTAEPKYRYRSADRATSVEPPGSFWESYSDSMANADFSLLVEALRENDVSIPPGADVGVTKDDKTGDWLISIEGREENEEIEAQYNTCLKMAKKRAYVGAVQQVTAASDIFTQDLDDPDLARQMKEEKGHPQNSSSQGSSSQGSSSQSRSGGAQPDGGRRGGDGRGRPRSAQDRQREPQSRGSAGKGSSSKGTPSDEGPPGKEKMYGVMLSEKNARHVANARESLGSRPQDVSFNEAAELIFDRFEDAPEPLFEAIRYMIADEKPEEGQKPAALPEDTPFREKLIEAGIRDTAQLEEALEEDRLVETVNGVGPTRAQKIAEEMGFSEPTGSEQSETEDSSDGGSGNGGSWEEGDPQDEFEGEPPF